MGDSLGRDEEHALVMPFAFQSVGIMWVCIEKRETPHFSKGVGPVKSFFEICDSVSKPHCSATKPTK